MITHFYTGNLTIDFLLYVTDQKDSVPVMDTESNDILPAYSVE